MVPLMTGFLGLSQHRAHGTSLAVIIFVAAAGLTGYWITNNVNWSLALWLSVGSAMGAYFGAVTMSRLAPNSLRLLFGVFLMAVAVRMFFV